MSSPQQIEATAHVFTTKAGVQYKLPRLTVSTRRPVLRCVSKVDELRDSTASQLEIAERMLDLLTEMMLVWLEKMYPGITADQIEEDWDITDIPGLMAIVRGGEAGPETAGV